MITMIERAEHPIFIASRWQTGGETHTSATIGARTRAAVRAMVEELERRFARFAGVPYQDPLDLEIWEQLWEMEPNQRYELRR